MAHVPIQRAPRAARLAAVVLCALLGAAATLATAGPASAGGGLGPAPRSCAPFEYLTSSTCLIDSRLVTFTISPRIVRVGDVVTATAEVHLTPGAFPFTVSFGLRTTGIGQQVGGCADVTTRSGLTSTCRFRVTGPTGGWRTVSLSVGTTAGPAFSRDPLAVLGDPRGAVEGTILRSPAPAAPASPAVAGVRVAIDGPGAPVVAVTDADGYYFALLPQAGRYTVTPRQTGEPITPARRVVSVNGSTAGASFTVKPACTPPTAAERGHARDQQAPPVCGPPIAAFERVTSRNPRDVSWEPSGSSDPGGRIVAYDWDFGDGVTSHKTAPIAVGYAWPEPGLHTVTLTVTDDEGNKATATRQVETFRATIKLRHVDDGEPVSGVPLELIRDGEGGNLLGRPRVEVPDRRRVLLSSGADGIAAVVLPKGRYFVRGTRSVVRYVYSTNGLTVPLSLSDVLIYDDKIDFRVGATSPSGRSILGVRVRVTGMGTRNRRVDETGVSGAGGERFTLPQSTSAGYLVVVSCFGTVDGRPRLLAARTRIHIRESPRTRDGPSFGVPLNLRPVTGDLEACPRTPPA